MNMKSQMEKHIKPAYFLREEKQPALGILGIISEAFKTSIKNGMNMFSITFFMFICYYPLESADRFILVPVYSSFISKYKLMPKNVRLSEIDPALHKAIMKDVRFILIYELIVLAFSYLILITSTAAVIQSTHEAYTAKVISFKEMLLSIRARWKRFLITTFCMILISLVSIAFFLIAFGLIAVMTDGSLSISLVVGLIISGICFYIYLSAIWILSLVVSVLEENSSAMKDIDRARELMNGKKLQGCVLMLILLLAGSIIYWTFALLDVNAQKSKLNIIWDAIDITRTWLFCLKKLFVFVVVTMFYHECKRSHTVVDETKAYVPISAAEV